jgi:hypothetical protein
MNITLARQVATLGLILAPALSAQAAGTLYTDLASYQAALSASGLSTQIEADFAAAAAAGGLAGAGQYFGVQDPTPIVVGSVTFTGLNNNNANGWLTLDNYGIANAFYDHGLYSGTDNAVTITFATPVRAFAFNSNAFNVTLPGPVGPLPMTLSTSAGDVVNAYTSPLYWAGVEVGMAPIAFNGYISDTAFSSVTIAVQTQDFNVTSISAAVPEPSAYGLALSGFLVVGSLAWRRNGRRAELTHRAAMA